MCKGPVANVFIAYRVSCLKSMLLDGEYVDIVFLAAGNYLLQLVVYVEPALGVVSARVLTLYVATVNVRLALWTLLAIAEQIGS